MVVKMKIITFCTRSQCEASITKKMGEELWCVINFVKMCSLTQTNVASLNLMNWFWCVNQIKQQLKMENWMCWILRWIQSTMYFSAVKQWCLHGCGLCATFPKPPLLSLPFLLQQQHALAFLLPKPCNYLERCAVFGFLSFHSSYIQPHRVLRGL